jgi:hypothetical protein
MAGPSVINHLSPTNHLSLTNHLSPTYHSSPAHDLRPTDHSSPTDHLSPTYHSSPAHDLRPTDHLSPTDDLRPADHLRPAQDSSLIHHLSSVNKLKLRSDLSCATTMSSQTTSPTGFSSTGGTSERSIARLAGTQPPGGLSTSNELEIFVRAMYNTLILVNKERISFKQPWDSLFHPSMWNTMSCHLSILVTSSLKRVAKTQS